MILKPGQGFRSIDKTTFKAPPVLPKCELDRVSNSIKNRFRISLEPIDTKMLLKGNPREVDVTKWLSKKDFNPITHGESHRQMEYARIRMKDEPYVSYRQGEFRKRSRAKEIGENEFRFSLNGSPLNTLNRTPSIRSIFAE